MIPNDPDKNPAPAAASKFEPGQKVAGCYTLQRRLEAPGPLTVWLARDEELEKDLTLHFIPDAVFSDAKAMTELRQETKRNRQLIHPHILRVHDLIEEADWAAISMENVEGPSLSTLLQRREGQLFGVGEVKGWIAQLCQTIEDAHKIDLLHRDLVPDNVIVKKSGDLVLANFGITRVVLDALERAGNGTADKRRLAYTSPQLLDGERPARSDDIYALGALIYELVTGTPPFHSGDLIPQIRKTPPAPASEHRGRLKPGGEPIPKAWDREIAACLDKHTPARPKTALEIASKLGIDRFSGTLTTPEAALGGVSAGATLDEPKGSPAADPKSDATPVQLAKTEETTKLADMAAKPATQPGKPSDLPEPKSATSEPAPSTAAGVPVIPPSEIKSQSPEAKQSEAPGAEGAEPLKTEKGKAAPDKPLEKQRAEKTAAEISAKSPFGSKSSRPPIAEAEIISKTVLKPKSEGGTGEPAVEVSKAAPKTPQGREFPHSAFVTLEDQKRRAMLKKRLPVMAFGVVAFFALLGVVFYNLSKPGDERPPNSRETSTEPAEEMKIAAAQPGTPAPPPSGDRPAPSVSATVPPTNTVSGKVAPLAVVSAAQTGTPAPLATGSDRVQQAGKQAAEKARAAEALKQAVAAAEKEHEEKVAAARQIDAATKEVEAALNEKTAAAASAKKAADEAAGAQKQREEAQKTAERAAEEAQKLASERTRLAAEARRAVEDNIKELKQQQSAQQKAEAELKELQAAVAERRKAAEQAKAAAAAAETARHQQAEAAKQAAAEVNQAQANIERVRLAEEARKAALDAEAIRAERAKERERLMAQAAAAQKAAEEAARLVQVAQKAEEEAARLHVDREAAQKQAEQAAGSIAPLPRGASPMASPSPAASPGTLPSASPGASARPAGSKARVDAALENSLGMKFAPVGDVLFSVWQTRIRDFEAFAKATNLKSSGWRQPGFKQGPDHPVVNVSWNDAIAFCKWLTEKEQKEGILASNQSYRLPTDLEWSKAAGLPEESGRTPEARDMDVPDVYPWGTDWPPPAGAGNYTGEETGSDVAIKGYDDGFAWTSPVGSFKPNKFGLFDMGGNVWQWCMDWLNADQKAKVLRGGSWYNGALKLSLLSSCRYHAGPDSSTDNFGFRVVIGTGGKK